MTHNRHENRQTLGIALALVKYSCTKQPSKGTRIFGTDPVQES